MDIREVRESDAAAISAIYAHHVRHGTASFDYAPPPTQFHHDKIRRIAAAGWPFIVVEEDGQLQGYAYVTQFRDREGYRFTAEDSIYVHPDAMRRGVGRALLNELLKRSATYGFRTVIAVIGGAEPGSIGVHAACGFREVGRLSAVGFKRKRWLDSVYMQVEFAPPGNL